MFDSLMTQLGAVLLAALRIGPTLAFAPPFTLVKLPALARAILVTALALAMLPTVSRDLFPMTPASLLTSGISELALGIALALTLQLAFAMISVAGRAIDIQAGFGLASLIDPTTRAQNPLISAIFTYAAAAIFFTTSGPYDVVETFALSFDRIPPGAADITDVSGLLAFLGGASVLSLGVVGLAMIVLFTIDLVIALLSRTLPQMNVLVLGFQIKAIVAILVLPATIGFGAAAIVRILRLATEAMLTAG